MDSFEELGVAPELVEALAGEGIERPTPLQEAATPVLRQGNNLVLAAGPGAGLLVAWAVPLLERVEPGGEAPRVLVLTSTAEVADRLAESTARLATMTGHSIAALGSRWGLAERCEFLFGTPADVLAAIASGRLALSEVVALVVDQAQLFERLGHLPDVERVIDYLPAEAQRVLSALPRTDAVTDLVGRHFKRAPIVPPPDTGGAPPRGRVHYRITPEPREDAALALAGELLDSGSRHVLFFCGNEDRAADLGDYLTLHGYLAGAPGDEEAPVWLGVDALAARAAAKGTEDLATVSLDVPTDPDTLDRRHGFGSGGTVIALAREIAHFKAVGRATGYETVPSPPPPEVPDEISQLRDTLEAALREEDTAAYLALLEPLFERFGAPEVAAAAISLLRRRDAPAAAAPVRAPAPSGSADPAAQPAWAKLFIGVGEQDQLKPGDLLGAITGEAGVDGRSVGKIEIRERHSLVEVHDAVARDVIKALNGTTIRGRAVRADFDRPRTKPPRTAHSR